MKIIREFGKLPYESYEKKRPNHEHTYRYFYQARHIENCMMRSDALNSHVYPVRTEMTALYLQVCSTDEDESKRIIVNETLSQSCSTHADELFSTEEDKSECTITKQKDANNEVT